eukprot:CAMPEP_0185752518 /NCGR_PEP_ID=MMETSP1174-20130828/11307_1 /TAXON_ID=35687 /ORGANISM="Dictyocha speculum, Strain CCMP1381" /LENGTH=84 /DNA_ID=CAMNT_0028430005 /DNA_START=702 /DNA_END=956 /DNA_ORIENTATION=-
MAGIFVTGFRKAAHLKRSGCCPMRCAPRKPPCDPPTTPTRLPSTIAGSRAKTNWAAATTSLTSCAPMLPGKLLTASAQKPVDPR